MAEWLHCFKCDRFPTTKTIQSFFMGECGHMYCPKCATPSANNSKLSPRMGSVVCVDCKKTRRISPMAKSVNEENEHLFESLTFEEADEALRYASLHYEIFMEHYRRMYKKYEELKNHFRKLVKEVEDHQNELRQLKATKKMQFTATTPVTAKSMFPCRQGNINFGYGMVKTSTPSTGIRSNYSSNKSGSSGYPLTNNSRYRFGKF